MDARRNLQRLVILVKEARHQCVPRAKPSRSAPKSQVRFHASLEGGESFVYFSTLYSQSHRIELKPIYLIYIHTKSRTTNYKYSA